MPCFLYLPYLNFFACFCWLAPKLLAKLPVSFYTFQKEFVLASSNLLQSDTKNEMLSFKRHFVHLFYFISFCSNLIPIALNYLPSWLSYLCRSTGRRRRTRRRPKNQRTRIPSMAPINIQMVAMDI